jgi:hypothetical protein
MHYCPISPCFHHVAASQPRCIAASQHCSLAASQPHSLAALQFDQFRLDFLRALASTNFDRIFCLISKLRALALYIFCARSHRPILTGFARARTIDNTAVAGHQTACARCCPDRFKLVVVVVVADTSIRLLHFRPISPCFQHIIAPLHTALPGSLARASLAAFRALARQLLSRQVRTGSAEYYTGHFDRI